MPMPQIVIWVQRLPHHPSFPRINRLLGCTLLPNLVGEEVECLPAKGLGNKLMLDMWVSDQSWLFQEFFYLN